MRHKEMLAAGDWVLASPRALNPKSGELVEVPPDCKILRYLYTARNERFVVQQDFEYNESYHHRATQDVPCAYKVSPVKVFAESSDILYWLHANKYTPDASMNFRRTIPLGDVTTTVEIEEEFPIFKSTYWNLCGRICKSSEEFHFGWLRGGFVWGTGVPLG